jgi:hypothetical protein
MKARERLIAVLYPRRQESISLLTWVSKVDRPASVWRIQSMQMAERAGR